jgi:hypothetical protein
MLWFILPHPELKKKVLYNKHLWTMPQFFYSSNLRPEQAKLDCLKNAVSRLDIDWLQLLVLERLYLQL